VSEQILFETNEIISFKSAVDEKRIFVVSESHEDGVLRQQCFMSSMCKGLAVQKGVVDRVVEAALWDIEQMIKGGADRGDVADGTDVYPFEHGIEVSEALHVSAVIDEQESVVKLFIGLDSEVSLVSGLAGSFL